jgi:transposase
VKVLHERVAGIDVHKDMIKVAIRSPGEKPWTRKTEVFEFRTFYGVLQEMARELRRRGVTHVVMEASGVYTDPVYYALAELDFTEVIVVNPAHVKALKGHKTDPLTELPGEVPQVSGRMGVLVATVADHDHRRGCAAGPVPAGDAAGRVA